MFFGGSCPVVMGAPCSRGGMLNGGTSRACCAGTSGSRTLGCYGAPSSTVAFAGGTTSFLALLVLGEPALHSLA